MSNNSRRKRTDNPLRNRVTITLNDEDYSKLWSYSETHNMTISLVIRRALEIYLNDIEKNNLHS